MIRCCICCNCFCILQVCRHLAKLFDNTADLKFSTDADGNKTKIATGMYSKEKEFVQFEKQCDCTGQVFRLFSCFVKTDYFYC